MNWGERRGAQDSGWLGLDKDQAIEINEKLMKVN